MPEPEYRSCPSFFLSRQLVKDALKDAYRKILSQKLGDEWTNLELLGLYALKSMDLISIEDQESNDGKGKKNPFV